MKTLKSICAVFLMAGFLGVSAGCAQEPIPSAEEFKEVSLNKMDEQTLKELKNVEWKEKIFVESIKDGKGFQVRYKDVDSDYCLRFLNKMKTENIQDAVYLINDKEVDLNNESILMTECNAKPLNDLKVIVHRT